MEQNQNEIVDLATKLAEEVDRCSPPFKDLPVYKQEQELKILSVLLGGATIDRVENESDVDYRVRCFREMLCQLPDLTYPLAFVDTYLHGPGDGKRIHRRMTFNPHEHNKSSKFENVNFEKQQQQQSPNILSSSPMWSPPDKSYFVSMFKNNLSVDKQEQEIKIVSFLTGGVTVDRLANESDEDYRVRNFADMFTHLSASSLYPEAFRDSYEAPGTRKNYVRMTTYNYYQFYLWMDQLQNKYTN